GGGLWGGLFPGREKRGGAAGGARATPPITSPLPSRRTFLALDLTMVWLIETWPSPPITTEPPLRTVRMVVPCQCQWSGWEDCIERSLGDAPDLRSGGG